MYFLSKLFNLTCLSPFIFLVIWLICFINCRRNKNNTAGIIFYVFLISFYLLGLRPIKNLLVTPLENCCPVAKDISCQVLIVAGGGVIERSPEKNLKPVLTDSSLRRCLAAYAYWKKSNCPIIVSGGTPLYQGTPEAVVMADFLQFIGIPKNFIIVEPLSRNTFENVENIKKILQEKKWQKIGVITSAVHMPRAMKIFKRQKIQANALPTNYYADWTPYSWFDFLPSAHELEQSFSALHEYVGIVYYKLYYRV